MSTSNTCNQTTSRKRRAVNGTAEDCSTSKRIEIVQLDSDEDDVQPSTSGNGCDKGSSEDDDIVIVDNVEGHDYSENEEINNFLKSKKPIAERIKINACFVKYDALANYRAIELEIQEKIKNDPILRKHLKRNVPEQLEESIANLQALRLIDCGHLDGNESKDLTRQKQIDLKQVLESYCYHFDYRPPERRIRIMRNISLDAFWPLPMYSDLPNETLESLTIQQESCVQYKTKNVAARLITTKRRDLIDKITTLADLQQNKISCGCVHVEGKLTRCSRNPNCRCYKINEDLKKCQKFGKSRPTNFKTFEKINVTDYEDCYFNTFGFSCSESCECSGVCDNNVMYLIEKNINKFEIYRHDLKGFGVRALNYIPVGTPVFEFTGEIADLATVEKKRSSDYSYHMTHREDEKRELGKDSLLKFWKENGFNLVDREMYKAVKESFKIDWFIDPKEKGNLSRYVTHGCQSNLGMIRVFQKGFSPVHSRCIMVSTEEIFAGTQLTFDYGPDYLRINLKCKCLCGTIGCAGDDRTKILKLASKNDLINFYRFRHHHQWESYQKILQTPVENVMKLRYE